ncbi:uncharacterized protein LOC124694782 [Lolium rigidum]|uniref:uncharacterized protein LOC124694782 n=1 Tax=Lolium rigidum TaxID=89674 RepID=UPI001F5C3B13|nr:uncharacterized protein LOC124694782 [Lolium rigidum]
MAARPPPPLVDDLMREIFQRVRPHDPRALVRAAAGCTSWRGIICDADFAREYREFHGAPPMLGFLHEELDYPRRAFDEAYWVSHFVSTATFRPPACQERPYWHALDSRHGLVLFYTPRMEADFVVCDLLTGNEWEIHASPKCGDIMWWEDDEDEKLERIHCNAAVLCANDRCDHLDCHGGPFRVALVGSSDGALVAHAIVYSSETGEWSDMIEVQYPNCINGCGHSAVVGSKVYVPCLESDTVLEYNFGEQKLSVIDAPFEDQDQNQPYLELMGVEDGMLFFASVVDARLYLWSMEAGPSGTAGWAQRRVIELEPLLPPAAVSEKSDALPVGFAEGVSVIFLRTEDGLYTIDLKSGKCEKVHDRIHGFYFEKVMPYMSFYTGAWGRLPNSQQASHAVVGATTI